MCAHLPSVLPPFLPLNTKARRSKRRRRRRCVTVGHMQEEEECGAGAERVEAGRVVVDTAFSNLQ
eukprot:1700800-Rhodomonas_salina.1